MKMGMWLVVGCMLAEGIVGCRYADGYDAGRVGKIDWDNPNLVLRYDEYGGPFLPREILTVRFADRMLKFECEDGLESDHVRLNHKCTDAEWRFVLGILKGCHMEKWRVSYSPPPDVIILDGGGFDLEITYDGVKKGIYGYNESPDNFEQFLRLKKYAREHPAAVH